MAKLNWTLKDEETLIAKGEDTGVEFEIKVIGLAFSLDAFHYEMTVSGSPIGDSSESLVELMLEAQAIENRTEERTAFSDPDFGGFAPNH